MPETVAQEEWTWRDFGAGMMLVTQHRGAKVVLCAGANVLEVRGDDGVLRPLHPDDEVARVIVNASELRQNLRRMVEHFETWANDHSMEATAETWSALHCAKQILAASGPKQETP